MKKLLFLVLSLAMVSYLALPAQALSLKGGNDVSIHLKDATSLYAPNPAGGALLPRVRNGVTTPPTGFAAAGAAVGDEARAVANLDEFTYLDGSFITVPTGVLTALSYDLKLGPDSVTVGSFTILSLIDSARKSNVAGLGGHLDIWLDEPAEGDTYANVFNPLSDGKAPTDWIQTAAGLPDQMPGVNAGADSDSVLWLSLQFVPSAVDSAGNLVYVDEIVNNAAGTGSSLNAYLDITGGVAAPLFTKGGFSSPLGLSADVSLAYTFVFPPDSTYNTGWAKPGGWAVQSSDPATVNIIPEPATIGLLSLALASLGVYRKRRN